MPSATTIMDHSDGVQVVSDVRAAGDHVLIVAGADTASFTLDDLIFV